MLNGAREFLVLGADRINDTVPGRGPSGFFKAGGSLDHIGPLTEHYERVFENWTSEVVK